MLCCAESWKASAGIFSNFWDFCLICRHEANDEFRASMLWKYLPKTCFLFSEATLRMKAQQQFVARWGHQSTSRRSRRRQQQAQGGRANEQWQQKRSGYFCFISYISCLQCFLASSVVGSDLGRTRTCNPRLGGPMPYPLGHEAAASFFCVIEIVITSLQNFYIFFWVNMQWSEIEFGSCCTSHTHETTGSSGALTSSFHRRRTQVPLAQAARIQMPHVSIYLKMVWIRSSARRKRAWARNTCGRGGLTYYTGTN